MLTVVRLLLVWLDACSEFLTGFSKRKQAKLQEKREKAKERDKLEQAKEKREVSRRPCVLCCGARRWVYPGEMARDGVLQERKGGKEGEVCELDEC